MSLLSSLADRLKQVPTTRDPTVGWKQYLGAIPFRDSTNTLVEYFDLEVRPPVTLQAFGVPGYKEQEIEVVVVLAVSPAAIDATREQTTAADASLVGSALEVDWVYSGADATLENCELVHTFLDKTNAQRWLMELKFHIMYLEPITLTKV